MCQILVHTGSVGSIRQVSDLTPSLSDRRILTSGFWVELVPPSESEQVRLNLQWPAPGIYSNLCLNMTS